MIVTRHIGLTWLALAGLGLGLILIGFFVLLPGDKRTAVAWLDLVVCGAVFLVNFSTLPVVRLRNEEFSRQIPKLGILWTTHVAYTTFALAGIWYGWTIGVPFRVQLLYQLAVLFGLVVLLSIGGRASEHVSRVSAGEQRLTGSLDALKAAITGCEAAFARLGSSWTSEYSQLLQIKEDVRYLSPCATSSAVSLDLKIASLLDELSETLSASGQFVENQEVQQTLTRCQALLRLRKQERQALQETQP